MLGFGPMTLALMIMHRPTTGKLNSSNATVLRDYRGVEADVLGLSLLQDELNQMGTAIEISLS